MGWSFPDILDRLLNGQAREKGVVVDTFKMLAEVSRWIEDTDLRLPFSPWNVSLVFGCSEAEDDHANNERIFAHTLHLPRTICVAQAFEDLKDGHKLGIILHEFGHLYGGRDEGAADLWVDEELGIDIDYVDTVQWVEIKLVGMARENKMAKSKRKLRHPLAGRKIVGMRKSTQAEIQVNAWYTPFTILELDDGSQLFAMGDEEGNNPGVLIHQAKDGVQHYVFAQ